MTCRSARSRGGAIVAVVVLVVGLAAGCGSEPKGGGDTGADAGDVSEVVDAAETGPGEDTGGDATPADADATGDVDAFSAPGFLCESCTSDGECGDQEDRCVELPDETQVCARACDPSKDSPCPKFFQCANFDQDPSTGQCIPNRLACKDRCSGVSCSGEKRCDPLDGECEEPLGRCDNGCTVDKLCGDGPEDRCLTIPDTASPRERVCVLGCNPEADSPGCAPNYRCAALNPDTDPTDGVCFPLKRTCIDRCSDKSCPDGENCNRLTGMCEQSQYGACEKGCMRSAQCGDQDDWCLNLGIGTGAHCWLGCGGGADECPENYRCAQLQNSTVNICVPESMRCQKCYGTSCYPGGACDPETGMCEALPEDCTQTGCASGEVCDPRSTDCVEIGRSCSGGSWAADCDNIVTSCTTRRSGTEGTCERICTSKSDCSAGESCVDTNHGKLCLGDALGGPKTCGTLHRSSSDVGAPCSSDSDCGATAPTCVDDGGIDGFCSKTCTSDSDCSGDERCALGASGAKICIPPQCRCAAGLGLGQGARNALHSALGAVGLSLCDIRTDPSEALASTELSKTPLASRRLAGWLEFPAAGMRDGAAVGADAGGSSDAPDLAVESAAEAAGASVSGQAGNYTFPGSNSKLTQAAVELINAAGGTPQPSTIETKAKNVPAGFQDLAAPIVMAVADAYRARDMALQSAGWGATRRSEAFDGAPYLLLPGEQSSINKAPDLSQSSVVQAYRAFPTKAMTKAAADLAATVESAKSKASNPSSWTGFSFVVDTPAGKIVLGDANDTTYDPSTNSSYSGEIALLIDPGGSDTYRLPAGGNQSVSNGVALTVDLGGTDTYSYDKVGHMRDTKHLLTSDADGRKKPAGSLSQGNGPVALSKTSRQGAGRVGIGMLVDYGSDKDVYESLRMSQGAAVFGVGLLYDAGGPNTFEAEALAQGAALGGIGAVWSGGGDDDYEVWHAGQGFGSAAGTGLLFDRSGSDSYTAVQGKSNGDGVLYLAPADKGTSNRNLAQGAGAGVASGSSSTGLGGGLGVLRDGAGGDSYTAATYAQGYGTVRGVGVLSEAAGVDTYEGRALVQGAGQWFGGGLLDERGGDDDYDKTTSAEIAQGLGEAYGWGAVLERGGDDEIEHGLPGGGVGLDGGIGFFVDAGGTDRHSVGFGNSLGLARNGARSGSPLSGVPTIAVFVDAGGASDTYNRSQGTQLSGNNKTWKQPDPPTMVEKGVGLDR